MGRITNAVGVRLGNSLGWFNQTSGFRFKKSGIKVYWFIKYLESFFKYHILEGNLEFVRYIFGNIKIVSRLSGISIVVSLYRPYTRWKRGIRRRMKKKISNYHFYRHTYLLRKFLTFAGERYFGVPCTVRFVATTNNSLDAQVILTYIQFKLDQGFTLNEVIYPLARMLRRYKLLGFRVECKGRLTRRQRASFRRLQVGRVPLSSLTYPIQFASDSRISKYGKCGLKVWLCKQNSGKFGYEM